MKKSILILNLLLILSYYNLLYAQWNQCNGPYGGNVRTLAINGSNIYAGIYDGGGIFLSTNNGANWTAVNSGLTNLEVRCLAIDNNNIFAGSSGGGIFLSTNNGTSWASVNIGLTDLDVQCLAIIDSNIFAGTSSGGIFLSTNNGVNWTAINSGLTYQNVQCLVISGSNIFAGTWGGGVFLSTNNGTTWTAINSGLTSSYVLSLAINGSNIFAGTYSDFGSSGVFLSTNNGTTWAYVGLTGRNVYFLTIINNSIFAATEIASNPSYTDVYLSTNNGTSWTKVYTGLINQNVYSLAIIDNNVIAGTRYGGIFFSTNNGTNWSQSGFNIQEVKCLATSGSNILAGIWRSGAGIGVFLSTNNGNYWNKADSGLIGEGVKSFAISGSNIFAGNYNGGGVFLSTNNGLTWTSVNTGLTNKTVQCLAINGSNVFAGTFGGGIFHSTNNGEIWTEVNNGLTNHFIQCFAESGSYIFAGTYGGGIFLSTNNGENWTEVNNGLTYLSVGSLGISGGNIFAGTNGGLYLSTNNGESWVEVASRLTSSPIYCFVVNGSNIFAGTSEGVYLSKNNGSTWAASGIIDNNVLSLTISGNNIFAGTRDSSVYIANIQELLNLQSSSIPNLISPVNNSTNIEINSNLKWNQSSNTVSYHLEISLNLDMSNPIVSQQNITDTIYNYSLSSNKKYYWRVRSYNDSIYSNWSEIWNFTTKINDSKYPTLYLSKSSIIIGDSMNIFGKSFYPNGQVNLNVTGPQGYLDTANILAVNDEMIFTFHANNQTPVGYYQVNATDKSTGRTCNTKFLIKSNETTYEKIFKIIKPLDGTSLYENEIFDLDWVDFIGLRANDSLDWTKTKRYYKYEILYKTNKDANYIPVGNGKLSGFAAIGKSIRLTMRLMALVDIESCSFKVIDRTLDGKSIIKSKNGNVILSGEKETPPVNCIINKPKATDFKIEKVWDYSYSNLRNGSPKGVCADGVSRIYLNLKYSGNQNLESVKINLYNGNQSISDSKIAGKIMVSKFNSISELKYDVEGNNANQTTLTDYQAAGKKERLYCYVAPDDFARDQNELGSRTVNVEFTVKVNGQDLLLPLEKIDIVRPPLMLVHGLGGDRTDWSNFKHRYKNEDFTFVKDWIFFGNDVYGFEKDGGKNIAVGIDKAESFNTNSIKVISLISNRINFFRKMGYSANRVDYVGHSMGGIVVRVAEQNKSQYYCSFNYNKGYVNKLITIDSPHNGSPLANLVELRKWLLLNPVIKNIYPIIKPLHSLYYYLLDIIPEITPALKDLRLPNKNNNEKSGYIIANSTNIKSNLIYGIINDNITSEIIPKNIIKVLQILTFSMNNEMTNKAIENIYLSDDPFRESHFIENSDLIVANNSQTGSIDFINNMTIINGIWHCNVIDKAGDIVFELLNEPINSGLFGPINANSIIEKKDNPMELILNNKMKSKEIFPKIQAVPTIEITGPIDSTQISVNDYLNVKIIVSDTIGLQFIMFNFQNEIYSDTIVKFVYEFNIPVSGAYLESQSLAALAVYKYSEPDTNIVISDEVRINVITNEKILALDITPKIISIPLNMSYKPDYKAIYETFISDLSLSKKLSVEYSVPNIVEFDTSMNSFKGIKEGETRAIVSYEGLQDTLYITVEPDISNPDTSKITISLNPYDIDKCEDESAIFSTVLEGNLTDNSLSYHWYLDSNKLSDDINISGSNTNTLTISKVDTLNEGEYYLEISVENPLQNYYLTTTGANLTVKRKPRIISQDTVIIEKMTRENFTLQVIALGTTPIHYQWYKDGLLLLEDTLNVLERNNITLSDNGIYKCKVWNECDSTISVDVPVNIIVNDIKDDFTNSYQLFDCLPNPFDEFTNIRFTIPETGHVRLTISEISGREIIVLADRIFEAGINEIKFKVKDYNLSNGTYLYSISVNGFKDTKKMVLIK
ncbi:MAG: T9SS type A sorting domain-containing protein [Bacteroidetes bacterium]|nr:MAG: T9SS type A sorting domain-containing protein [Bacteroidota bacterium]